MKKKRGKKYYNEVSNPVSMLARGRIDGYNQAIKDLETGRIKNKIRNIAIPPNVKSVTLSDVPADEIWIFTDTGMFKLSMPPKN